MKCGSVVADDRSVCAVCGAVLDAEPEKSVSSPADDVCRLAFSDRKYQKILFSRIFLYVVLLVSVLILLFVLAALDAGSWSCYISADAQTR